MGTPCAAEGNDGLVAGDRDDTLDGELAQTDRFSWEIEMHDLNVAAGAQLTVDAAQLRVGETLAFDRSAETDGSYRVFGLGDGRLTGGEGADTFVFAGLPGAADVDTLADFSAADDSIHLSRAVFSAIASDGTLAAGAFHVGTGAADADDRIVYDQATGRIFYDADGSGAAEAVLFATVSAGTELAHLDFSAYTPVV